MAWLVAAVLLIVQSVWLPATAQANFGSLPQEEKMARRHPQPVRVGDLVGLPVLDEQDSTIGYISDVVRTPAGKIQLVVPYGRRFGWVRWGGPFDWDRRPVGVPIETVAILGRQVDALEMPREAFDKAPVFVSGENKSIDRDETIKIALGRR
ncbi:PRC-barrel domain-containing protein [Reyranella sp.]|uniref:PRC-barrel domain-containing protein n=1 Tax=Reyranella sp. TaxID=1929291 RepID=UPI003D130815